jgi:hypothetical protein
MLCESSIISCRLFLRLKRRGIEDEKVSAMSLDLNLSSPTQSKAGIPQNYQEDFALQHISSSPSPGSGPSPATVPFEITAKVQESPISDSASN